VIDPVQALLEAGLLPATPFPPTSRYHGVATGRLAGPDGRTLVYLRRRFVPPVERFVDLTTHTVKQGDRLDVLAARYLGDPEQFWRVADANAATNPVGLTAEPGRTLRVPVPQP